MRREIAWWLAACHASGERQIHASEWNRWAATAAEVARRRPEVCSFADLSLGEWMTAWGRVFHAGHGRMASAASRARAEIALRALLPGWPSAIATPPWWQHDIWCLRLDPRIPRRRARAPRRHLGALGQHRAGLAAGRFQVLPGLQLESGQLTWSIGEAQHVFVFRFAEFLASRGISYPALAGTRPRAACPGPGVPGVPAVADQDPARPVGRAAAAGRADRSPAPCRRSAILPGDERLPGRGRRRDSATTGGWR